MKNYLLTSFACILLMLPNLIHAQESPWECRFNYGKWSDTTIMPEIATWMASGLIDGKIYLAGGSRFKQNGYLTLCDHLSVYDPENNSWDTTRAGIPVCRMFSGSQNMALDGKFYLIGGAEWIQTGEDDYQMIPYARVDVYDPQTDTWESKTPLPIPLAHNGVCSMDGKFYVSGGVSNENTALNSFYSFDPETDTWEELTEMPGPRAYHGTVALEGKIYVIGGDDFGAGDTSLASCEVYDPESGQWAPIASLPHGRFDPAVCIVDGEVDGEIYVFGGTSSNSNMAEEAYKYKPEDSIWLQIDDIYPERQSASVVPIGRTVYLIGGWQESTKLINTVQTFELSDVILESFIPDMAINDTVLEIDLSEYFSHLESGDINYTACTDNPYVLATEINGDTLRITGKQSGISFLSILAESGEDQMGDRFRVNVVVTGISESFRISPSLLIYPNPSIGTTTLAYSVLSHGTVRLEVYDLLGKRVAAPLNEYKVPGDYEYQLNTVDLEPGIYFCDLTSATGRATVKLIVGY